VFRNRLEAGQQLGLALRNKVRLPAVVLGIPRGGVIVAGPVAAALGVPLDVVVPRKIGAPGEPELAIGALAVVDGEDILVYDDAMIARLGASSDYLAAEAARQRLEIARRLAAYREGRPAISVVGQSVVIVDDGIATGLTARVAAQAITRAGAASVMLAVPVAPVETAEDFARLGVRLDALALPPVFMAVGQFYADFRSVEDDEVRGVLRAHAR
jgi:putative phosphoribosyl transferase